MYLGGNHRWVPLLQGNPTVASPKEQLYEQTTSNTAFTERNIQKANAYLLDSPADICEQWERNLPFSSADVRGVGTRDEPL